MATKKLKHLAEDIDETIDSFAEHKDDANKHVTQSEKAKWNSNVSANNGRLTIKKNGIETGSFSANQSADEEINVEVPTKVSELENDCNFINELPDTYTKAETDEKISNVNDKIGDISAVLADITGVE